MRAVSPSSLGPCGLLAVILATALSAAAGPRYAVVVPDGDLARRQEASLGHLHL